MSRQARIALTLAISGVFLFLALRGVEWNRAWAATQQIHGVWLGFVALCTVWTLIIRAQRWQVLLRPLGHVTRSPLVHATNIGFLANMVLPLRAGELVRPVLLTRQAQLPLGGVLATVVLERVFDLVAVLFLAGVATLLVPINEEVRGWGVLVVGFGVALAAATGIARWQERRVWQWWNYVAKWLPQLLADPLGHFVRGFLQALEVLDRPRAFLALIIWTLYLWAVIAAVNTLGLLAFSAAFSVPLISCGVVLTAIVALAVSVPSAPGYVGAFQLGCQIALEAFDVDKSSALAFSVVLHVTQFLAILAAGVYSLVHEGVSFRQLEEVSKSDVSVSPG